MAEIDNLFKCNPPRNTCPRCKNSLGSRPIFLGTESEGHICGDCWENDRAAEDIIEGA